MAMARMRRKMWWISLIIFGSLVIIYCIVVAIFANFQARLIYYPHYPTREIEKTPEEIGIIYEDVTIIASDGVKLSAWFIPVKDSRGVFIFCHGNAGNISHRLESIRIFTELGFSVFIFDYRGYGQSEGVVSEKGTYLDAEAAWNYCVNERNISPSEIVVFGRSLGASIAAWLAQDRKPKALIIESAFTSIPDIAAELYPFLPVRLVIHYRYNTIGYLKNTHCPVLIIHSIDDEMVSIEHARRLYEGIKGYRELLEIRGTHNEGVLESEKYYVNGINNFFSQFTSVK